MTIKIGFLTYDLQAATEDCIYRIAVALGTEYDCCAHPVFYHQHQERSRISNLPSYVRGRHLGVTKKGVTPEGFTSNFNFRAAFNVVIQSDIVILFGLQGQTAILTAILARILFKKVISVTQSLAPKYERRRTFWVQSLKKLVLNCCTIHVAQTPITVEVLRSVYRQKQSIFLAPFEAGLTVLTENHRSEETAPNNPLCTKRSPDETFFLFVGNLVAFKGLLDLIEAASMLPPEAKWQVCFAGPFVENQILTEQALTEIVQSYQLADRIKFIGKVSSSELATLYQLSDVVVLPTHKDCAPKVIVEAALFEKPVITTDVHGWANTLVIDSVSGSIVQPGDIGALSMAMSKYLNHKYARELGVKAKQLAFELCDPIKEVSGFCKAIHSLSRDHEPPHFE